MQLTQEERAELELVRLYFPKAFGVHAKLTTTVDAQDRVGDELDRVRRRLTDQAALIASLAGFVQEANFPNPADATTVTLDGDDLVALDYRVLERAAGCRGKLGIFFRDEVVA